MKTIAILGSTGSIGTNTLKVAAHLGDEIRVAALAAGENIDLLEKQARQFSPKMVAVYNKDKALELQKRLPRTEVVGGAEGLAAAASHPDVDFVVSAISGAIGLNPTIAAIKAGKDIGLANKEVLVAGGELVMALVEKHGVRLIPIDSEHSALFQCLAGESLQDVGRLVLTASGGPFRTFSIEQLAKATVEQALKHPKWSMGAKITIDSSTLMNKGLEVIEARWLFDIPADKIDVVVHPQSLIHSLVEFVDGSMKAQISEPTMLAPIQYALTCPGRRPGLLAPFDFIANGMLEFYLPDSKKFPCLELAYQAIRAGGSLPCCLNAANEVLVDRFLKKQIRWIEIGKKLETLLGRHSPVSIGSLDELMDVDRAAREEAETI